MRERDTRALTNSRHPYVIVGAGQAGARAAETLRTSGFEGDIVLLGDESHLPYERPPLSKAFLLEPTPPLNAAVHSARFYTEKRIQALLSTRVRNINRARRHIDLGNAGTLPYSKLLLTTGSRPRRLTLPGADLDGVVYLRTVDDANALRRRVRPGASIVVIGGGLIGLEVAAAASKLGCRVTVLEIGQAVLNRVVRKPLAEYIAEKHRDHGVSIRTGVRVSRIAGARNVTAVLCDDGLKIEANTVVVGIGVDPNTELASEAGLSVENGIIVNEFGQTPDSSIYAAGDVANHPNPIVGRRLRVESWQHAQNHAIFVARAMAGTPIPYAAVPWSWTDQYGLNIQLLGTSTDDMSTVVRGEHSRNEFTEIYLRSGRVIGAASINNPRDIGPLRKLIEGKISVDESALADRDISLRSLLAS